MGEEESILNVTNILNIYFYFKIYQLTYFKFTRHITSFSCVKHFLKFMRHLRFQISILLKTRMSF